MVTSCDSHFPFISENKRTRKDRRYSLLRGWQIPDTPAVPSPLPPPRGRTSPVEHTSLSCEPYCNLRTLLALLLGPPAHGAAIPALLPPLSSSKVQTERLKCTRQDYFPKSHGPSAASSVCSEGLLAPSRGGLADKCRFTSAGTHRLLFLALALISEAASAGSVWGALILWPQTCVGSPRHSTILWTLPSLERAQPLPIQKKPVPKLWLALALTHLGQPQATPSSRPRVTCRPWSQGSAPCGISFAEIPRGGNRGVGEPDPFSHSSAPTPPCA